MITLSNILGGISIAALIAFFAHMFQIKRYSLDKIDYRSAHSDQIISSRKEIKTVVCPVDGCSYSRPRYPAKYKLYLKREREGLDGRGYSLPGEKGMLYSDHNCPWHREHLI